MPTHAAPEMPEGLVLEGRSTSPARRCGERGAIMPQSRGSMLVARALAPSPGQRVLDLCAAPGAKTTHLAALMGGDGELIAVERNPGRARALRATWPGWGLTARGCSADAGAWPAEPRFDAVLVDPPCSGLGTLQSRPGPALAHEPGADHRARRRSRPGPAGRGRRHPARRDARLLGLHDLA